MEAGVDPYNGLTLDRSVGTKIGGSTFDSSGRRHSVADLLSYAKASNIRVHICLCYASYASVEIILLASSSRIEANGNWGCFSRPKRAMQWCVKRER